MNPMDPVTWKQPVNFAKSCHERIQIQCLPPETEDQKIFPGKHSLHQKNCHPGKVTWGGSYDSTITHYSCGKPGVPGVFEFSTDQ